jgi:hypothetical protein
MKHIKPFNESYESIDFDDKYYIKLSFVAAWAYSKNKPLIPLTTKEKNEVKNTIDSDYIYHNNDMGVDLEYNNDKYYIIYYITKHEDEIYKVQKMVDGLSVVFICDQIDGLIQLIKDEMQKNETNLHPLTNVPLNESIDFNNQLYVEVSHIQKEEYGETHKVDNITNKEKQTIVNLVPYKIRQDYPHALIIYPPDKIKTVNANLRNISMSNIIYITKMEDDIFFVIDQYSTSMSTHNYYYLCDTIDGLIQLLKKILSI